MIRALQNTAFISHLEGPNASRVEFKSGHLLFYGVSLVETTPTGNTPP